MLSTFRRSAAAASPAFAAPAHRPRAGGALQRAASPPSVMAAALSPAAEQLVQDAVVWASQHGLVVGLGDAGAPEAALVHAPLSALPVTFPRERFQQAVAAQPAFNRLVDAVARDEAWLAATLARAAAQDDFTGALLALLRDTAADRARWAGREVVLGVHRSDYMLDAPTGRLLQVELNTIASSFGCLSSLTSQLHAALLRRLTAAAAAPIPLDAAALPPNAAINALPAAMAAAVEATGLGPAAVVVMVVQPGERNAYDQQWLQAGLWEHHGLRTLRLTLAQIASRCSVRDSDGTLLLDGATPVGLVYFRAGYTPNDYPTAVEWEARRVVESSAAARCPSAAYQLAGSKKVQQALAQPGELERFVSGEEAVQLRALFAGLWPLEDLSAPDVTATLSAAAADPGGFVLKPQREGGGNNVYGAELAARLAAGGEGLAAFILMERIRPPPQRALLVRRGAAVEADTLSELGVYGVYLRRGGGAGAGGGEVLLDEAAGHLVRTKTATSDEGGVAAGFAVLDSPYLVAEGEAGWQEGVLGAAVRGGLL